MRTRRLLAFLILSVTGLGCGERTPDSAADPGSDVSDDTVAPDTADGGSELDAQEELVDAGDGSGERADAGEGTGDAGLDSGPGADDAAGDADEERDSGTSDAADGDVVVIDSGDEDVEVCWPERVPNACGGCLELLEQPGDPCGCDIGVWTCVGADDVACRSPDGEVLYADFDGDGWGVEGELPSDLECSWGASLTTQHFDCNDDNEDVFPGAGAIACALGNTAYRVCDASGEFASVSCFGGRCVDGVCVTGCGVPGVTTRCSRGGFSPDWRHQVCGFDGVTWDDIEWCGAGVACHDVGGCEDEICDNVLAEADGDDLADCRDPDCAGAPGCPPLVFSPLIAWLRVVEGVERLYVGRAGGEAVEVAANIAGALPSYPAWVPGTSELSFVTVELGDGQVLRRWNVSTGEVHDVDLGFWACDLMAFPSWSVDSSTLWVECPDEREVRRFTVGTPYAFEESISGGSPSASPAQPDDYLIVYRTDEIRIRRSGGTSPTYTSSGSQIVGRPLMGRGPSGLAAHDFPLLPGDVVLDVTRGDTEHEVALISRRIGTARRQLVMLWPGGRAVEVTTGDAFETMGSIASDAEIDLAMEVEP